MRLPAPLNAVWKTRGRIAAGAVTFGLLVTLIGLALAVPPNLPLLSMEELARGPAGLSVANQTVLQVNSGRVGFFVGLDAPDVPIPRNTPIRLLLHFVKFHEERPWWSSGATVRLLDVELRVNGRLQESVRVERVPSKDTLSFSLAPIDTSTPGRWLVELRVTFVPIWRWLLGTQSSGTAGVTLNHTLEILP